MVPSQLELARATEGERQLVPLGTNEAEIGMDLYAPSNNFHFGTIVEIDRLHEFPD